MKSMITFALKAAVVIIGYRLGEKYINPKITG